MDFYAIFLCEYGENMTPGEEHILNACKSIEKLFSCGVCMHGKFGTLVFIPYYHVNKVCTFLKRKYRHISSTCYLFDSIVVHEKMQQRKAPFYKICPAGLCEVVVPVIVQDWVVSYLFAGPFLPDHLPEEECFRAASAWPSRLKMPPVPSLPSERAELLRDLLLLLADLIARQLADSLPKNEGFREITEKFIRSHHHLNIGLDDLCDKVHLSRSRVSRRLKETFHATFPELLNRERIRAARNFLANTSLSIADIAKRCGYADEHYFHRVFREIAGTTPKEFRTVK